MLIPNLRKTWAPKGKTPILRHSQARDRISTIGALTVSSKRQRFGLYLEYHAVNITGLEVIAFLQDLLRHLPGPIMLLWDGGKIHRRREVVEFLQRHERLRVHRFPSYAPELNPIEFVWSKSKNALSNSGHTSQSTLHAHLRKSIRRTSRSQQLLRSCIQASDLPWR